MGEFNTTASVDISTNVSATFDVHTLEYSKWDYIPWEILYAIISIPTVTGNILILMCLSRFRDIKSSIHILVGNLAVSDLIVGGVLLPYCIVLDALNIDSQKYFCLTKVSLMVFSVCVTCYGLLLVSIDRFSAICFPLHHSTTFCTKRIVIMLVIGWSYLAVLAFIPLLGWNLYEHYEDNLSFNCQTDRVLTPINQKVMYTNFFAMFGINLVLYVVVVRIAIKKANKIYSEEFVSNIRSNIRELYKIKTMAMVQGLFAVCWFPFVLFTIALIFSDNQTLHNAQYWSLVPGILNSSFNWLIYGYRNKELRKQMKSYIKCACVRQLDVAETY